MEVHKYQIHVLKLVIDNKVVVDWVREAMDNKMDIRDMVVKVLEDLVMVEMDSKTLEEEMSGVDRDLGNVVLMAIDITVDDRLMVKDVVTVGHDNMTAIDVVMEDNMAMKDKNLTFFILYVKNFLPYSIKN